MTVATPDKLEEIKKRLETAEPGTPAHKVLSQLLTELEDSNAPTEEKPEEPPLLFQAVGVVRGVVEKSEEGFNVNLGQYSIPLFCPRKLRSVLSKLTGQSFYLRVYPQVRYEKGNREICHLSFQLIAFNAEPMDMEAGTFILRGIWQFIPQYKRPVISIYRNVKRWEGDRCKAQHIPVLWKDASVSPFRFNPKEPKAGEKYFVQVKAKFIPSKGTFGVIESLAEPTRKIPRYLKPEKPQLEAKAKSETKPKSETKTKPKSETKQKSKAKIKPETEQKS